MVCGPVRVLRCPAWVFARWSGRHLAPRLAPVVGPSGTGMRWSRSHRAAGGAARVPAHAVPESDGQAEFAGREATHFGGVEEVSPVVGEQSVECLLYTSDAADEEDSVD